MWNKIFYQNLYKKIFPFLFILMILMYIFKIINIQLTDQGIQYYNQLIENLEK